jgi:hypothetical protein
MIREKIRYWWDCLTFYWPNQLLSALQPEPPDGMFPMRWGEWFSWLLRMRIYHPIRKLYVKIKIQLVIWKILPPSVIKQPGPPPF